jgi:hypothetical protein
VVATETAGVTAVVTGAVAAAKAPGLVLSRAETVRRAEEPTSTMAAGISSEAKTTTAHRESRAVELVQQRFRGQEFERVPKPERLHVGIRVWTAVARQSMLVIES